jgi:NIPSNAP protein
VEYQLRHYKIRDGRMDAFVAAWLGGVYPLRRKFGFTFVGAWRVADADEFVWILGYDGPDGFAAADRRYYASEERKRMAPDPAALIERPVQTMLRSVLPGS